jgi:hypothetical protein
MTKFLEQAIAKLKTRPIQAGDSIELRSINLTFPIEQVYEEIVFKQ